MKKAFWMLLQHGSLNHSSANLHSSTATSCVRAIYFPSRLDQMTSCSQSDVKLWPLISPKQKFLETLQESACLLVLGASSIKTIYSKRKKKHNNPQYMPESGCSFELSPRMRRHETWTWPPAWRWAGLSPGSSTAGSESRESEEHGPWARGGRAHRVGWCRAPGAAGRAAPPPPAPWPPPPAPASPGTRRPWRCARTWPPPPPGAAGACSPGSSTWGRRGKEMRQPACTSGEQGETGGGLPGTNDYV